jgi:C2H2 type zinc-finger (2 copies)
MNTCHSYNSGHTCCSTYDSLICSTNPPLANRCQRGFLNIVFDFQIKLINFIRRQMHLGLCINCSDKFDDRESLFEHMKSRNHLKPPEDATEWDQPQASRKMPTFNVSSCYNLMSAIGTNASAILSILNGTACFKKILTNV